MRWRRSGIAVEEEGEKEGRVADFDRVVAVDVGCVQAGRRAATEQVGQYADRVGDVEGPIAVYA